MEKKQNGNSTLRNITITAICIAMCVLLPILFHFIPQGGRIFSPIHIPVLICGLACSWQYGLICGAVGVILSSAITSMPALAQVPAMAVECAVYGLASALLIKFIKTGKPYANLYLSLICSMILGRIAGGAVQALFLTNGYTFSAWISGYFAVSLPGILLHLILVPPIVRALTRAGLIAEK